MSSSMREELITFKRERILEAAAELFYERGYQNTTLDAIADQLSVRKPFIYSYFQSKSDLLAEVCERGIRASLAELTTVMELPVSATERVKRLGTGFVIAVLKAQKHIAIFSREEKNLQAADFKRISDMRREFDRKLNLLLEEGCATGEFTIVDRQLVALAIGGMVSWAYVWYRPDGRLTMDEVAERMSTLMLAMVGAGPPRPHGAPDT